ncbi:hypothetical protein Ahy_B05g076947 [Arachis hypogaea]|uniref:F-box domain-containing protein n=1 Tax=Arachis hypogaea TaxID=3818 RepID=A0A444Z471_ARAHY|nr:hypothetical protein Ahy_B05g076947 [Arachis hypogaea]
MAGGSMKNKKKKNVAKTIREKGTVSVEYEYPLNLLPHDIWVRIAMTVALYSIKDLFNMQATCKVFLDAARYDAVYKEASMLELLIVSFLYYYGRPEHRFIECCAEAGNPVALLRVGMTEFVWIGHCDSDSGALERCREVFKQVEVKLLDPGLPEVCWSTNCRTRGTMGDVEDLSRVSCVQCLADYEVRVFRELFVSNKNVYSGVCVSQVCCLCFSYLVLPYEALSPLLLRIYAWLSSY